MKNKLIVLGDMHVRHEEPFYSAMTNFIDWFVDQSFNNENNILLQLGDIFHSNEPTPREYDLVFKFLGNLKFKNKYILAGNGLHEYQRIKKSWAIEPLLQSNNTRIIRLPTQETIGNLHILMLPWIPTGIIDNKSTMKQYYENLPIKYTEKEHDYIFGHFAHKEFFGTEIDIDYLSGKKRMGHIHIPTDEYVGVPVITRYDEKGIECSLQAIDLDTKEEEKISIPKFLDYNEFTYPEKPEEVNYHSIYDIYSAPNKEKIYEIYPNIHIRNIHLKNELSNNDSNTNINSIGYKTRKEYLEAFFKNKDIKKDVQKILQQVIV